MIDSDVLTDLGALGEIYLPAWKGTNQLCGSKKGALGHVKQGYTMRFHRGENLYVSDERLGPSYKAGSPGTRPSRKAVLLTGRHSCGIWIRAGSGLDQDGRAGAEQER